MANRRHNEGVQIIYYIVVFTMLAGKNIVIHHKRRGRSLVSDTCGRIEAMSPIQCGRVPSKLKGIGEEAPEEERP